MKWWRGWLLVGVLVALLAPGAVAKVTLDKCASGEAIWWYEDTCLGCLPCFADADDDAAAELGVFMNGDKAAVWLEVAEKFDLGAIAGLGFDYRHIMYLGQLPTVPAGPGMALALKWFDGLQYRNILALSAFAAPYTQTACATFDAMPVEWQYSDWDGVNLCTFDEGKAQTASGISGLVTAMTTPTGSQTPSVIAAGAYMWKKDATFDATRAIVDDVLLQWGVQCGGVYNLQPPWPEVYTFETPEQRADWRRTGLWSYVQEDELWGEPAAVRDFPSSDTAAYFGAVNPSTGTGSYDGKGARVFGYFESPCNMLNPGDVFVDVSFDYYRLVESYKGQYPNQVYDRTWVEIRWIYGGVCEDTTTWPTVVNGGGAPTNTPSGIDLAHGILWYMDSSYPQQSGWNTATLLTLDIPCNAIGMQLRFWFDSVDGFNNNYFGWMIDNVRKVHGPTPHCLKILTPFIPQATVKQTYSVTLTANKPGVRWEIVVDPRNGYDPLPQRLVLVQQDDGTALIVGHPEIGTQGTYKILVRAIYGDGRACNTAEKEFTLAIRSPEGPMASNTIYAQYFEATPASVPDGFKHEWFGGQGWTFEPLWHPTSAVLVGGNNIVTDPDYVTSAYFGLGDPNNPSYNNGKRVKGCLTSPWIAIPKEYIGEKIIIGFKSWRWVEFYLKGAYDKTWVEVRLEGQPWKQVWYKDSNDASEKAWTWEELDTCLTIPPGLPKFQIRFCFDSMDGHNNGFVGWLVDEVAVLAGSAALAITTQCPLPEAQVGLTYTAQFTASGGPAGTKTWEFIGAIPPGLSFSGNTLSGVPREAGSFPFTIKVTTSNGSVPIAAAEKACVLVIKEKTVLLFEDFEKDPVWTWGGLWHITQGAGAGGPNVPGLGAENQAAYYGIKPGSPNANTYNTGDRTTGSLTLVSPVINLTGVGAIKVFFDYWREVEPFSANGAFDMALVQVKLGTGTWTTIWQKTSADPCEKNWLKAEIGPFLTNGATTMLIRFVFDSVDKWYNNFLGWLLDNIRVEAAPTNGAQALSAAAIAPAVVSPRGMEIGFFNSPNPVRDVHTTTFAVRGVEAERIKVEIYDLAGRLVYVNEVAGSELVWHTQDVTGLPLANGVYLYKVYVKVGETWVMSSVQKLTVLR